MRRLANAATIRSFMRRLGRESARSARVYFTGGATAVLSGWREATIDVDLAIEGDADSVLRAVPRLKEELEINVELASPADFLPELPGWRERSIFIAQEGKVSFFHYDPCAQLLAKIERGHAQDLIDVQELIGRNLADPSLARELFARIEPKLYRYPAVDPESLRRAVGEILGGPGPSRESAGS
jgi:hypothetical protein